MSNSPGPRELISHRVNGLNEVIRITAFDDEGQKACHRYRVWPANGKALGSVIEFQRGPLRGDGGVPNGLSNEALLAIIEDRLEFFQASDLSCIENEQALNHVRGALHWLKKRTEMRVARGVEGTMER